MSAVSTDARPHPVAAANATTGAIATVIAAVVGLGVIPAATGDRIGSALPIIIPAIVALMSVVHTVISLVTAKAKTTPSSDPKASVILDDGTAVLESLVPASYTHVVTYNDDGTVTASTNTDHADQVETTPPPETSQTLVAPQTEEGELAAAQDDTDDDQLTFDDDATPAAAGSPA